MTLVHPPALGITLPAVSESLGLLRHVVRGFRDAYVIGPATMDDIVLAVSEAATNVVMHAYGSRPGWFTVVARMRNGRLHVMVRDDGCGIRPPADTPRPGRGLGLMNHVAASLEIIGGPEGTDVLMTFDLAAEHDLPLLTDFGTVL